MQYLSQLVVTRFGIPVLSYSTIRSSPPLLRLCPPTAEVYTSHCGDERGFDQSTCLAKPLTDPETDFENRDQKKNGNRAQLHTLETIPA